jgi:orfa protein
MEINNDFVMTVGAGKNMKEQLEKLANSKGFTERNTGIFVGKADLEEKGLYSYIDGTKEVLDIEDFKAFEQFEQFEFVGFCGNQNVYLYK